jgi:surface antigen
MKRILIAAAATLAASWASAMNLGFLGNSVLQRLTEADVRLLSDAIDAALVAEEGSVRSWSNPDTGATGTVTVQRIVERAGQPCRRLRVRTSVQAISSQGVYEICRLPDGGWTFGE